MRNLFFFALSLALFSGCFGQPTDQEAPPTESPQQAFDRLSQENRAAISKEILDQIPMANQYDMSESTFAINASAFIPEEGVDLNAEINITSQVDNTNPESPESSTEIQLSGKAMGEVFSGEANALLEVVIAQAKIYARIREITVDIPNIPISQIMDPIEPIIGQWYGDSFDTINESLGEGMNLQDILAQGAKGPAQTREDLGEIIKNANIFDMQDRLEDENGFAKFAIRLNKESFKKTILDIISLSNPSEEYLEQVKQDMDKDFENFEMTGTVRYLIENPKFFTLAARVQETNDAEIIISYLESEKIFSMKELNESGETEGHATLTITHNGETNTFDITGGENSEEKETLIKGTQSENSFSATLYDVDQNKEFASLSLEKQGNIWSGEITNTENPKMIIKIDSLSYNMESFSLKITVVENNENIGNGSVNFTIREIGKVNITPPGDFEPFAKLMETFLPIMMMGASGAQPDMAPPMGELPPMTPDMTDEELEALFQEMMEAEGLTDENIEFDPMFEDDEVGVPTPPAFPTELLE
jgi:hypothetical protein